MSEVLFIESKDNILIDIVEQIFTYSLALTLLTALQLSQQLFLLHVTLFGIKYFFQSEKVLSCLLVQFLVDIAVNVYEPWDHDMLQGVYSPVCHLYLQINSLAFSSFAISVHLPKALPTHKYEMILADSSKSWEV